MFRGSKNKKRVRSTRPRPLLLSAAALAVGCGISGVRPVQAAGYVYQQNTLNAGVLVNDADIIGNGSTSNPAPYLFYVLNNRADVRPVDLNLVNPLAPATITQTALDRWSSYTLGQAVTPNMAPYWEVSLNNTSDSQLAQYNVLYLRADGITFPPSVNEKLRRFVDGGGQLIVEYEGAPFTIGLFTGTGVTSMSGTNVTFPTLGSLSLLQPIVSQPYLLSPSDLSSLATTANPVPYALSKNIGDTVHVNEFNSLFSPALADTAGTVVSAAQIGAGQVVASTLNIGLGISVDNAATFAPTDLSAASAPDLKLLANILTWSEAHPSENKTSHGSASNSGLASFSPAWQYPVTTTGTNPPAPSGAAVWGNFVFAVDAAGILRAFDAYPSENLTGAATMGDDGTVTDYSLGKSYDEIWNTIRSNANTPLTGASTPTVASFGSVNYVFVEKNDGTVAAYNVLNGTPATAFTLTAPASGGSFMGNAPAPTLYDGRLYAGQANGTMHVYDLNEGTSVAVTLDPNTPPTGTSEPVTAAPSVGFLPDGNTNVLVAIVPTTLNVYTVLLGGRNEPLAPYPSFGAPTGYSISRQNRYFLPNIFADINATAPALLPYDYSGNMLSGVLPNNTAPNPQDPLFITPSTTGYFTDWNMDFANAGGTGTPATPLNLNYISAASLSQLTSATPTAATSMSAPAIDRHGDYYYTETLGSNSYLVGVKNAPLYSRVQLKFRFLIPTTGLTDGDNVDYTQISGYHFVGAPVVDDQDNVYVAATNGTASTPATLATVLCFHGDQQISATPPAGSTLNMSDAITQADEDGGDAKSINRGDGTTGQFIGSAIAGSAVIGAESSLQFYNFGTQGQVQRQIAGNLTEPQPVMDADATPNPITLSMHTNLAWFVTPFTVTGPVAGLTQVGSSLLLTDGANLYRVSASPQVGAGRIVSALPSRTPIGAGTVVSAPSVGGSVLIVNSTSGLVARTRQVTVIADNNRVLGVDGDGSAVWAVDATTRTDTSQTPNVSTKVGFNRPTALSQFAPNDFLVADTGNNRCVRFDSGGTVQWELTRFQDPQGLLGAGQPLTLSQPSSVVVRTVPDPDTTNNPGGSYVFYLVADSGNNRIVEVEDRLNPAGGLYVDPSGTIPSINHALSWVTHTGDRNGRSYRYGSATYYPAQPSYTAGTITPTNLNIAATVTNTRLAPLTATGLGAVSGDAPGGSIAVFTYPATVQPFSMNASSDLAYTTAGFYTATVSGGNTTYTPFTIRNPRFLQLVSSTTATAPVSPNPNNVPAFNFLYADDNGAFDLTYDTTQKAFVAGADRLQFKTTDYQGMNYLLAGTAVPVPAVGVPDTTTTNTSSGSTITYTNLRQNLPFVPTCIQALSTDTLPNGTNTSTVRRYLITQNYSQGELGSVNSTTTGTAPNTVVTNTGKIGGEVFEVDVTYPPVVSGTSPVTTPGGFGVNSTLSHPLLTGPLTQPTYAVRLP